MAIKFKNFLFVLLYQLNMSETKNRLSWSQITVLFVFAANDSCILIEKF
jgi:hypothetical protein